MGSGDVKEKQQKIPEELHFSGCGSCGSAKVLKGLENWEEFWDVVVDPKVKRCCYVLGIDGTQAGEKGQKEMKIVIPKGLMRTVVIQVPEIISLDMKMQVTVGEGGQFGMRIAGILGDGSDLSLEVSSEQTGSRSKFVLEGRVVCKEGCTFNAVTKGKIAGSAKSSSCRYNVQVLQLGGGGVVTGEPSMEILSSDVVADHGFAVGRIPEEALLYMKGRGLAGKDAEDIYAKGFLQSAGSDISGG